MNLLALTHRVSPRIGECELTHQDRVPIDLDRARAEHAAYCGALRRCGAEVIDLDVNADHPDGTFIEDTAVVMDEAAVLARPGAASRRGEVEGVAPVLGEHRDLLRIEAPGTLEGGDVLRMGRRFFVGRSSRTNGAGIEQFERCVAPFGYRVAAVPMERCLHLKTACTALDEHTLLVCPERVDISRFGDVDVVEVPESESPAANALAVGGTVLLQAGFPVTLERVTGAGFRVFIVDITELRKAESGLTCSSVLLNLS